MDLVIRNASQVLTCTRPDLEAPYTGQDAGELGLTTGGVAIEDGRIAAVGPDVDGMDGKQVIDAQGGVVLPGFVDCHTHAVFHGSRADEFELRAQGTPYQEIARRGGGIRRSMELLREATDEQLEESVRKHLDWFLQAGTTTIEAKSGYGLSLEDELRSLRALGIDHPVEVTRTCLAAHSVPPEYEGDTRGYLEMVANEIYPAVLAEGLARYCDVFCETGVFSFYESQLIMEAGRELGLRPRIHADQLSRTGGARLACRVGAISADHIEFISKEDAVAMRDEGVIGVLLPAANHILDQDERPPARAMIGVRCPVAVATDFNPGSAPVFSMPLTLNMACVRFGLTVAEAIVGATMNAACAIERQDEIGSLRVGKQADVLVCDVTDYREIAYYAGRDPVSVVVKRGVVRKERGSPRAAR
ncbi:MAG: imidazolonepropionase [Planctomycetota bacterium]